MCYYAVACLHWLLLQAGRKATNSMSDHTSQNLDTPTSPGIQRGVVTGWEDGYPLVLVLGEKVPCRGKLLASACE